MANRLNGQLLPRISSNATLWVSRNRLTFETVLLLKQFFRSQVENIAHSFCIQPIGKNKSTIMQNKI